MVSLTNIDDSRTFWPAVSSIIVTAALSFESFHLMAAKRPISCLHR